MTSLLFRGSLVANILTSFVLANDTDVDTPHSQLFASFNAIGQFGTAIFSNNGTPTDPSDDFFTFTPLPGFTGQASFQYQVFDGYSSSTGTVFVTVTAPVQVNTAITLSSSINPVTLPQSPTFTATVSSLAPTTVGPTGLVNFFDGTTLLGTSTLFTILPTEGVATLTPALSPGSHVITAVYVGESSFNGSTSNAVIQGIQTTTPPVAQLDFVITDELTTVVNIPVSTLLANDSSPIGAPLYVVSVSSVSTLGATVSLNDNGTPDTSDDVVVYTQPPSFASTPAPRPAALNDVFDYTISDGSLTATATVHVTVTLINGPPVTFDDSYQVFAGQSLVVPAPGVLANDYDPANVPFAIVSYTQPSQGTVTVNPNGSFTYVPFGAVVVGTDTFTYTVSNGKFTAIGTVFITDPPAPTSDSGEPSVNDANLVAVLAHEVGGLGHSNLSDDREQGQNGEHGSHGLGTLIKQLAKLRIEGGKISLKDEDHDDSDDDHDHDAFFSRFSDLDLFGDPLDQNFDNLLVGTGKGGKGR